jgi:hypothetical protein
MLASQSHLSSVGGNSYCLLDCPPTDADEKQETNVGLVLGGFDDCITHAGVAIRANRWVGKRSSRHGCDCVAVIVRHLTRRPDKSSKRDTASAAWHAWARASCNNKPGGKDT